MTGTNIIFTKNESQIVVKFTVSAPTLVFMNYTLATTGGGIGTDNVNMNFNNAILKNDTDNFTVASFGSTN